MSVFIFSLKGWYQKMNVINDLKSIRQITGEAHKLSEQVVSLFNGEGADSEKLAKLLDTLSAHFERSTVSLRNLCENVRPNVESGFRKPPLPSIKISGKAHVDEYGWVHIELYTLLPHCRFQSPEYLTDTVVRLLDEYEHRGKPLPRFEEAVMVIDEHCDIDSRAIYDQDNKGYKAISNAVKGRLVRDDDQFTLGVVLISTRDRTPSCRIHLIPPNDLSDFFYLKYNNKMY